MEGGTSLFFKRSRVLSFGKVIPLAWWVPQRERAVLATASTLFWLATIQQALNKDPAGASVLAFYGLSLFYCVFVMANVGGGARASLKAYRRRWPHTEQPRALVQLYGIMVSILIFNTVALGIYLEKGASLTPLDLACITIALITLVVICLRLGWSGIFKHPFARGYMAIACKAAPQLVMAGLFLVRPNIAHAFTIWSLVTLGLFASLRFWPSLLAFKRDRSSRHMQGLILGESANMVSILLLGVTWSLAMM